MFNFRWLAGLFNGLEPHLPPLSSHKNKMLIFGLCSTSGDRPGWSVDSYFLCHPSPAKKILHSTSDDRPGWSMDSNPVCHPFPANKNEMLVFGLRSTSDDQLRWSVDSNPICHPSPAKKIKCSFLDYIQLLMISQAGRWNQTPSATPLQPKK